MALGLTQWMDRRLYPHHGQQWDDRLFREEILKVIGPGKHVLDLGAGAGIVAAMNFRGLAARVCGVDPDERVLVNPHLDEGRVGIGEAIPYPDATFDVVFADNVFEHLEQPARVFAEAARILKPGGVFLAKTPNRNHYVAQIARLTPHRFHQWVNEKRGRQRSDTFPTFYRANTVADITALARGSGLRVRQIRLTEGRPEYLRMSPLTYLVGWLYERTVNAFDRLEKYRVVVIAVLEKPF